MARLRYNGLATGASGSTVGLTLGGSLTSGATSVTFSAALTHSNGTAVPTIVSPDYIPLEILDANGRLSEIVYLTAYTAAATTGTISRGKEGTTGVAHSSGDKIVHGATAADIPRGFTQLRKSSTQSVSAATWTAVSWDTEDYDTLNLHDNATNNSRITAASDGILQVATHVSFTGGTNQQYLAYYVNGVQVMGWVVGAGTSPFALSLIREFAVSAGDYVEAYVYTVAGTLTIYKDMAANIAGSILTARMVGVV